MSVQDVTRLLDPAPQGYVGARLQQARTLLDSDTNEGLRGRADDSRAAWLDVTGRHGSPDDGFLPDLTPGQTVTSKLVAFGGAVLASVLDYPIRPGVMHLNGWRLDQHEAESTVFQREFLQIGPDAAPLAQVGTQYQLSILRAWEQPVTAVEDSELLEPALHGADGGVRLRRMRRVEVRTVEAADCEAAFAEVLEDLGDGASVTYDPRTGVLQSNARLRLGFVGGPAGDCPGCEPALRGRYLGSEDQTIRIMLATADSYVWAFDSAAPLYRARLVFDGAGGARVEMLTPPKDSAHEPVLNQVVEVLPWSVLLENGQPAGGKTVGERVSNEKLAARVGVLATVDAPYTAGDRSFHARIDASGLDALGLSPSGKGGKGGKSAPEKAAQAAVKTGEPPGGEIVALQWDPAHPHAAELNPGTAEDGSTVGFVYLRFWHVKRPDDPVALPLNTGRPLGRTGVVPTFSGTGRRGDFWRATLRTAARDLILPWGLTRPEGLPPDGPREAVAPLALVEWSSLFGIVHEVVSVRTCRPSLPAITNRGCCTHVVSQGAFARFTTVQAAIDALPAAGGRICIREGTYVGAVRVSGRDHVVIEGCGADTVLLSPEGSTADALVTLDGPAEGGADRLVLRSLTVRAVGQAGIALTGRGVTLDRVDVATAATEGAETPSAVRALDVAHARLVRCHIMMLPGRSPHAALVLRTAGDVLVEACAVESAAPGEVGDITPAWGGIQVMGDSHGVEIRGGRVSGWSGHGITLGSARWRATDGSELTDPGAGFGQMLDDGSPAPTGRLGPVDVTEGNTTRRYHPEPDPVIGDVLIADCTVSGCRGSGIGSPAPEVIHAEEARAAPLCMRRTTFAVEHLEVRDCALTDNAAGPGAPDPDRTRGGVVLSEARRLTVRNVRIAGPARDADSGPRCGLFVAFGADLVIDRTRITLTAPAEDATGPQDMDLSGGIVLSLAHGADMLARLGQDPPLHGVRIEGNGVSSAHGPALSMLAGGPCAVCGNALEAVPRVVGTGPFGMVTAVIQHAARVAEAVDLPPGEPSPERWIQPSGSAAYLPGRAQTVGETGGLTVADNRMTTRLPLGLDTADLMPVVIQSSGSAVVEGNQMAATLPRGSLLTHCFAMAAVLTVAGNRIAETIEAGPVSLVATAPMMTLGSDCVLTHCPVVFGGDNTDVAAFFAAEDNLTLARLQDRRCDLERERLAPALRVTLAEVFGQASPTIGGLTSLEAIAVPARRLFP
ncbi:hypothetical protein [Roseospira navarrensis]|uniref:Right handed beta helix domain-containing protein n=1 Tax=Roseospira navarrensis TaxID=140058 RepID=A0A7X2D5F6_9PROT|nr:hypothetical protein [Roseospira navarrensis]MQX37642.1 hypothetical protein [Roseospira navarrensis]